MDDALEVSPDYRLGEIIEKFEVRCAFSMDEEVLAQEEGCKYGVEMEAPDMHHAETYFTALGWSDTDSDGWLCPYHLAQSSTR